MQNQEVVRSRHVQREASRLVLCIHVGPANTAQRHPRVQPIHGQGRTGEWLNHRMKAQTAGGDEQQRALRFLGHIAHHSFNLHPLTEQFAGGHPCSGSFARLGDSPRAEHAHAGAVNEGRKHSRCRSPFDDHHLPGSRLVIGIGIDDANARRVVLDIDDVRGGIRIGDQALEPPER